MRRRVVRPRLLTYRRAAPRRRAPRGRPRRPAPFRPDGAGRRTAPIGETFQLSNTDLIAALERQEQALVFSAFDETTAFELGCALRAAAAAREAAVVIDIRRTDRRLFFAALPGSSGDNDEWARRKSNVTLRFHCSSMLAGAKFAAQGKVLGPDIGLDPMDYAAVGGSFPVRVRGAGVVAAVTVSGLPSREDHALIVGVLGAHLGVDELAALP